MSDHLQLVDPEHRDLNAATGDLVNRDPVKIDRRDFLFELGTEELPPKALPTLEQSLREGITTGLSAAGLKFGVVESFATPRRLAVRVRRLAARQPNQNIARRGPPIRAALDAAGQPTRAALAFAASCSVAWDALGRERDDKGNECLSFVGTRIGADTASMLPAIVAAALNALPIPKRMRWGASEAQFVRPVHWLIMLYGTEVIPAMLLDTVAGRTTRGHRFHAPRELLLRTPASYENTLLTRGKVIANFATRRERIRELVVAAVLQATAATPHSGNALITPELLDEVTALVEWPVAVAGRFEVRFLALPREVLIATLQDHQRYFAVEVAATPTASATASATGGPTAAEPAALLPWFITVSNIESRDPGVVRAGNERVVRPRLADAAFFWEQDRRQPLSAQVDALDRVTFQAQLGSIGAKIARVGALAQMLAGPCGASPENVARAALLCKCDLLSAMVGEFPELQGVMGAYYARADGEDTEVASAIREHYLPRGAGDDLPVTPSGQTIAIADRLDTLAGIFATGQKPSGTRDPFGLRRAAIGILRIARERAVNFDLHALIEQAVGAQPIPDLGARQATVCEEVYQFLMERLRAQYLDVPLDVAAVTVTPATTPIAAHITTEMFDAVLATRPRSILDVEARISALLGFLSRPEAASLTAANRRIANILKKSASSAASTHTSIRTELLTAPAEQRLHVALLRQRGAAEAALRVGAYGTALAELAQLRAEVDTFFEEVMVNDPNEALRRNRLNLLSEVHAIFIQIADLSRLPG